MALTWSTTGQHALSHGIKVCTHGRSGAGKTKLAATAPRPLILSAEAGTLSIAKENIPMIVINSMDDVIDAYNWIVKSAEAKNFDTICLDSISEIAEKCLSTQKAKAKDPRQAYGEMQDQIAVAIRMFRDLPGKNVYFSAKSELRQQPDGSSIYAPSMPGKIVGNGLAYYFDEFFYLGVGEVPGPPKSQYRYLQTNQDNMYDAKDRSGALDAIERPDLTYIFNKIRAAFQVQPA